MQATVYISTKIRFVFGCKRIFSFLKMKTDLFSSFRIIDVCLQFDINAEVNALQLKMLLLSLVRILNTHQIREKGNG